MEMLMDENFDEMFDLDPFIAEFLSDCSPEPQTSDEQGSQNSDPARQPKSSSGSDHGQEILSSQFSPQLISFEDSKFSLFPSSCDSDFDTGKDISLTNSQIINFASSARSKDSGKKTHNCPANEASHKRPVSTSATRDPSIAREHVLLERKRREQLGQLFIALSKVVPGLKKLDKISVLESAIHYLKALKEQAVVLEKEVTMKKRSSDAETTPQSSVNNKKRGAVSESGGPGISVRIANKHVLIKIFTKKEIGLLSSTIPFEMEKINLKVIDMRIMPFGGAVLDVTILAEMMSEFAGTTKEIVNHVYSIFVSQI